MNVHESEKIAGILERMGYTAAFECDKADIIVFNTCCIRETAEKKILGHLGALKKLKKRNPGLIVVLCGCMTQQSGRAAEIKSRFPFVNIILGTHNIYRLEEKLKMQRNVIEVTDESVVDESIPAARTSAPNAWVNIIYGCNNFCSYCIVPYVRGRERSRELCSVVREVHGLIAEGYKEITLLGQNVNSYGNGFAALLTELCKIEGKFRLRFMTSHPKDFTDEVIDVIAANEKICRHIHLPVQSGSDKILRAMNRKYMREQYLSLVNKIKERISGVKITTDIMVGFSGESEDDFLDTLDLVEKCRFSNAFCFIFSKRKGTAAEILPDEVAAEVKKDRIKRLIAAQGRITREISRDYIGNECEVLVEAKGCGRTDCGRLVNFDGGLTGQFVTVRITRVKTASLYGEVVRG